jgi:hypothetical protein
MMVPLKKGERARGEGRGREGEGRGGRGREGAGEGLLATIEKERILTRGGYGRIPDRWPAPLPPITNSSIIAMIFSVVSFIS